MKKRKRTRTRGLRKGIAALLAATLIFAQQGACFAEAFRGASPEKSGLRFTAAEAHFETPEDGYEKDALLRLPETGEDPEADALEEAYGEPVSISEHAKVYQTGEGEYKTVLSPVPSTYTGTFGARHEIDNTLELKSPLLGGEYFENRANSLSAAFPLEMGAGQGVTITKDGVSVTLIPAEGDYTKAAATGNAILYNDVFESIDVQYTAEANYVKEDIILRAPSGRHVFRYEAESPGLELKAGDGVINAYRWNEKEPVFVISAPQMSDAAGNWSEQVALSLENILGKSYITLSADAEWLSLPERVYPVRIDPKSPSPPMRCRSRRPASFGAPTGEGPTDTQGISTAGTSACRLRKPSVRPGCISR